ncbi:MAG: DUF1080 domain-containing protein [Verrucomicrobiae bacterium]|nr:DUF1080 domain-containing protein [Verrucomicrobiae bacterium]
MNRLFALAIALAIVCSPSQAKAQLASISVNSRQVLHTNSPYLTGACIEDVNHEIYGGLYSQMIFGESFQEPGSSSTSLAGFTAYGGSWLPVNGVLQAGAGSGPKLVDNGFNQTGGDVRVQLWFASDAGGNAGLILQVSQAGVGADAFNGYEISLAPAGYLVLGRHVQNFTSLSQVSCSVPIGQWITLEVQYTNASLNILINSNSVLQYTDTQQPLTSGQVGLRTWQQDAQFQNLFINGTNIPFQVAGNGLNGSISGMWSPVVTGTAAGQGSLATTNVFVGMQSQALSFTGGTGTIGLANQGLNHWGLNFVGGKPYTGTLDVRADAPATLWVSLESADGSAVYAEQSLLVTSNNWQQLAFNLTPAASDANGRFSIKLKQPGSVVVGYAFLQPGPWGCFQGLPVRQDVVQGLINQGVTVLRYGGSMVNAPGYRWKNMIGPRDQRPPYTGTWYPYSSDGWGIPDFLNFCEAAGFLAVPDFNINETPQDMADFMQYANGSTNTVWGARRLAEGHPQPYNLKYLELGNEETVNNTYYQKFQAVAQAIWAVDTNVILVVGDFSYHSVITDPFNFGGADSGITTLATHQQIMQLAQTNNRAVWFDVHVWTDGPGADNSLAGMFSYDTALGQIANGANYQVVVFELNANNHSQRRALGNALAINAIERDGRLPITTSANGLQPDGQNNNGWDQGLLFLNQSNVWLQPPGYVTQMYAANFQPLEIQSSVADPNNDLDVSAEGSQDGSQLVLQVVNLNSSPESATINISGFVPTNPAAAVQVLAALQSSVNTAQAPLGFVPANISWQHHFNGGNTTYTFAANSVTTITFQGQTMLPPPASPVALTHRWSFNEPANSTQFVDSVPGVTNGIIHGGARIDGNGNLVLGGLNQKTNYAELPPYLLTSTNYTAVTLEFWVAFGTNSAWGRLIDFGDTNSDTGNGRYCLDFTPHSGYGPGGINFEVSGTDPGNASVQNIAVPPILDNQGKIHLVLIWDSLAGYMAVYTNGVLQGINSNVTLSISAIVNAHSYLGKSSYAGDNCGVATIDEFRMYSGAMKKAQIADDYASGPNSLPMPKLSIATAGQTLAFTWPDYIAGYSLQTSAQLGAGASWTPAAVSSYVLTNGTFLITVPMTSRQAFYRIVK